jgi:dTDP-4-dehydrorhamnose 3,5-epimerase
MSDQLSLEQRAKKYIKKTSINGLYIVERETFDEERGFFREIFHLDELEYVIGREFKPVQLNHSLSKPKVIRGIHPDPWDKLVYPVTGKVFIAIADIEPSSSTFKKVETFIIDDSNRHALFLEKRLGNSICVLGEENVHYIYLVSSYWDGHALSGMRAVNIYDQDLNVEWPIEDPILSDKDRKNQTLRELYPEAFKEGG